ncbi:hypothetical protein BD311DRAFT_830735 [Dichomitus squalens]|uniref:Uncharacterized protein n=1 Tax=Dichomitus squalens TaxID=114155 RepID=A0A4Q9M435_9APHY|nr:hypothetical protein BD311DRAFT_830735 [Dichomitus squalens]
MDERTSPIPYDDPPSPNGETETANKRARTGPDSEARRSPIEQERVSQRKQPAPRPTSSTPVTVLRVALPLPAKPPSTMALATARFDPGDFTGLPTEGDKNPHKWRTRRGPPPVAPNNLEALQIPDRNYPHAHVPDFRLFGNVLLDQARRIREIANPKVAIVIHGGGQELASVGGPLKLKVLQLLSAITFPAQEAQMTAPPASSLTTPNPSSIHIHLPLVRKTRDTSAFGQPWTWFAEFGPNAHNLCEWLLYQEVFPISPTLSFSVHPIIPPIQPWTVMVLTGLDECAVEDSLVARQQVAKEIKLHLWNDRDFTVRTARQVQQNWGLRGDPVTLLKLATDTIDVVYVTAELKSSRKEVPVYLVYAKPPTNEKDEYQEWVEKFKSPGAYWRGAFKLDVNKAAVECKLCKDTSHCARACPLATDADWPGTVIEDIYTTEELEARQAGPAPAGPSNAGHDWQQSKARRTEKDSRARKPGKLSQQKDHRASGQGKGKGVRR